MKKLIIVLLSLLFITPVWAKEKHFMSYQLAEAIGKSNYKQVKKLLPLLKDNKTDRIRKHLFFIASYVCMPGAPTIVHDNSFHNTYPKEIKPVCKKKENAQIITLLLAGNSKDDVAMVLHYDSPTEQNGNLERVSFLTPLHYLKQSRPDLIPQIAELLDGCTVALTQMQELTPQDPYYYSYADYYRDEGCVSQDDDYIELDSKKPGTVGFGDRYASYQEGYGNWGREELKEYGDWALSIGMSKTDLFEKRGMPSYYQTPSNDREVITYRVLEESYNTYSIYDYIYTLDREVVTKIERKYLGFGAMADIYKNESVFADQEPDVLKKYETEERGY